MRRHSIAPWIIAAVSLLTGCASININFGSGSGSGSSSSSSSPHHLIPIRGGLSLGAWKGSVSESYGSQTSVTDIAFAYGGLLYFGVPIGPFFVDWSPTYLGVSKIGTSDGTNNAYYLSLASFEAGFSLLKATKVLPLEIFVGYDSSGTLGFSTGTQAVFSGSALKLGVALPLISTSPLAHVGLRAEARKNFFNLDNSGPVSLSFSSMTYYMGLAFQFSE